MKKKILLVDNYTERKNFEDKVLTKSHALRVVLGYMNEFISVNEQKCFESDIRTYFVDELTNKYKADFPPYVPLEKVFEMVNVSFDKFDFLLKKYNEIEIENYNPIDQSAPIPDLNIYATNEEQVKRFHESDSICKGLNNVKDKIQVGMIIRNQLAAAIRVISYDQRNDTFKINVDYVLKGF